MVGRNRKLSTIARFWGLLLLCVLLVLPTGEGIATVPLKISFLFSWKYSGHRAPYILTLTKGFFREQGLDVKITEGSGTGNAMQLLAANKVTFAESPMEAVLVSVSQGLPVRTILTVMQKDPSSIISWEDSNVRGPTDLVGKKLSACTCDSLGQLVDPLLKANGVDPAQVTVINADSNTRNELFLSKKVDAVTGFSVDTFLSWQIKGLRIREFLYVDHGLSLIGNGIVANTSLIRDNRDLVRRFTKALARGWAYSKQHPDEAMDDMLAIAPLLKRNEELPKISAVMTLTVSPDTQAHGWGYTSREAVRREEQLLLNMRLIKAKASSPDVYFTNEFLAK